MKYKSIDLFAGIGGIRLGFDQAFKQGIKTVFVSEFDEFAVKTYKANFKDKFDISGDITQIDASSIPDFDICLAGFPCQAFSIAGKKKGFDDDYKDGSVHRENDKDIMTLNLQVRFFGEDGTKKKKK